MIPNEFKSKFKNSIQCESKYENVFVDINADSFEYRIFEILETGKLKVRRVVVGRPAKTATSLFLKKYCFLSFPLEIVNTPLS